MLLFLFLLPDHCGLHYVSRCVRKVVLYILLVMHWVACGWHLLADLEDAELSWYDMVFGHDTLGKTVDELWCMCCCLRNVLISRLQV